MRIERGNLLSRAVSPTEEEQAWLDNYLTFQDDSSWFRLGVVRPLRLYNTRNDTFPTGFVALVKKDAPLDGHAVEVVECRTPPSRSWDWTVDLSWLRDYQLEGVRRVERMTRGILWIPTAGGKTEIAAGCVLACPVRWLFLVPKASLLDQTIERFALRLGWSEDGPELGRVGDGEFRPGARCTVATFQTLHSRLGTPKVKQLLDDAEGVFVDECFPAGTLVGGRPIETIRVGDLVPAFDEARGELVLRRVSKVFVRRPSHLVRLHLSDGGEVVCTPGHPFLTERGWLPAESLRGERVVSYRHEDPSLLGVRHPDPTHHHPRKSDGLLRTVQEDPLEGTPQDGPEAVQLVRRRDAAAWPTGPRESAPAQNLLLQDMPNGCLEQQLDVDRHHTRASIPPAHAGEQPDSGPRRPKEDQQNDAPPRDPPALDRREGARPDGAPAAPPGAALGRGRGLGDGASDRHEQEPRTSLQPLRRCGQPDSDDRDRDRRREPRHSEGERGGPPQGRVPSWARVDRVEVLEPGGAGDYGGLCPGGLVWNLSVDEHHTYLANGLVAHNCHTLPAGSFWRVICSIRKAFYRIGLSGTPLARGDSRSTMVIGGSGPVIYRLRPEVLIKAGVVARPRIVFHAVLQEGTRPTWQGVYGELIVRSPARNAAVVRAVQEAPAPTLIFVKEIAHGRRLKELLGKARVGQVDFVHGTHSLEARKQALERVRRGDLDRLVCSDIFDAGVDVPGNVRSGVNAAGGKSTIKALQRLGRGMRVGDDKTELEWHDFHDLGHGWIEKHSRARAAAYRSEGYEVTVDPLPNDESKTPSLFPRARRAR